MTDPRNPKFAGRESLLVRGLYSVCCVAMLLFVLCCVFALVDGLLRSFTGPVKQKPAYIPVRPTEHQSEELEFRQLPPSMCWARVRGQPSVWFYGVRRADGVWLLLPCQLQPSYEEYQALDY